MKRLFPKTTRAMFKHIGVTPSPEQTKLMDEFLVRFAVRCSRHAISFMPGASDISNDTLLTAQSDDGVGVLRQPITGVEWEAEGGEVVEDEEPIGPIIIRVSTKDSHWEYDRIRENNPE